MVEALAWMMRAVRRWAAAARPAPAGFDDPLAHAGAGWDDAARERYVRGASDMHDVERRERLWERNGWVAGG